MNVSRLSIVATLLLALFLAACGGPGPSDPYADPGTEPPAPIADPTIATSGTLSARSEGDLMDINVAGFLAPGSDAGALSTAQVPDLTASDFTVVEAGVVQGIRIEQIAAGSEAPADIVFVFDTTGSMGDEIARVETSIIGFVDHLAGAGLDVHVGAVSYGDAFATVDAGTAEPVTGESAPTAFDDHQRPVHPLTDDFEAFKSFIATEADQVFGGGNGPENGVGALAYAYEAISWRPGAQRILIVITDAPSHNDETHAEDGITGDWIPEDPSAVLERLRGNAVVHVVGPDEFLFYDMELYTDMAMFTGVSGTGGQFVPLSELTSEGATLTDLDVTAATAGGFIVTFRGTKDGTAKDVRVVIDDGSDIRGEFTLHDRVY